MFEETVWEDNTLADLALGKRSARADIKLFVIGRRTLII